MIFKGIRTSIAKEPYIFVIFQGGGVRTPCPPLDPHMFYVLPKDEKQVPVCMAQGPHIFTNTVRQVSTRKHQMTPFDPDGDNKVSGKDTE